jgi:hypothetical protein
MLIKILAIIFFIFFISGGSVAYFSYKIYTMKNIPLYHRGECIIASNNITTSKCCITSCYDCSFNAIDLPTCINLKTNLTVGLCDAGYYCCNHGCETCAKKKDGIKKTYQCNCGCKTSVNNRLCINDCGLCSHQLTEYKLDIRSIYPNYTHDCKIQNFNLVNFKNLVQVSNFDINITVISPSNIIPCYYRCISNTTTEVQLTQVILTDEYFFGYIIGIVLGSIGLLVVCCVIKWLCNDGIKREIRRTEAAEEIELTHD